MTAGRDRLKVESKFWRPQALMEGHPTHKSRTLGNAGALYALAVQFRAATNRQSQWVEYLIDTDGCLGPRGGNLGTAL